MHFSRVISRYFSSSSYLKKDEFFPVFSVLFYLFLGYLFTVCNLCFFSSLFSVSTFCVSPLFNFYVLYSVFYFCILFFLNFYVLVLCYILFSAFFRFYKISFNVVNRNYSSVVTRVKERFPRSGSIEVCFSMPGGVSCISEDCTMSKLSQERETGKG